MPVNGYVKVAVLVAATLHVGWPALAHEEFNFVGTVIKRDDNGLQIKTTGGDIVSASYFVVTRFWRGEQKVTRAEIKTGGTVKLRAYGDTVEDLLVLDVTVVAPGAAGSVAPEFPAGAGGEDMPAAWPT